MKLCIAFLIIGCLGITNVYGLSQEEKSEIVEVYNLTADLYALIVGMLDDLKNEKIEAGTAEQKMEEWEERYSNKTGAAPREARKMCDLMNEMIYMTRDIVHDYQPLNLRTKDRLDDLEDLKTELKNEMTELRYKLQ